MSFFRNFFNIVSPHNNKHTNKFTPLSSRSPIGVVFRKLVTGPKCVQNNLIHCQLIGRARIKLDTKTKPEK